MKDGNNMSNVGKSEISKSIKDKTGIWVIMVVISLLASLSILWLEVPQVGGAGTVALILQLIALMQIGLFVQSYRLNHKASLINLSLVVVLEWFMQISTGSRVIFPILEVTILAIVIVAWMKIDNKHKDKIRTYNNLTTTTMILVLGMIISIFMLEIASNKEAMASDSIALKLGIIFKTLEKISSIIVGVMVFFRIRVVYVYSALVINSLAIISLNYIQITIAKVLGVSLDMMTGYRVKVALIILISIMISLASQYIARHRVNKPNKN